MSNLVNELRQGSLSYDDYRWRAADEITALAETISQQDQHIENLTNINDRLRADIISYKIGNKDLQDHCAEMERLTAERDALTSDRDGYVQLLTNDNNKLRAEVSELNELFDARWSADMRAIECWRKVNPGNELVLPDHVELSLWLMEERTRLTAENEKLRAALEEIIKRDDEWVPETQDDYSYTGYQVCADIARAALAAGLAAWPEVKRVKGYFTHDTDYYEPAIILPLTQENNND